MKNWFYVYKTAPDEMKRTVTVFCVSFVVYENIIIIRDLSEIYLRPIRDVSETDMPDRRHIGDQHAWSETQLRPWPSKTGRDD